MVRDELNKIEGATFFHYRRNPKVKAEYGVWMEIGENTAFNADNNKAEQQIGGTLDYYTLIYARHYKTGEPMPEDLKERMLKSINFQSAYALGENLAATCVDMAWHMLASKDIPTVEKAKEFETEALRQIGLLDAQIPPRYYTSYFNHVWGGGYAAGYYSYLWTEVLAVNVADVFAKRGALDPATGQDMRDKILPMPP